MDMNDDTNNASVLVSIAHVQKAGSCDLILNKWALGNGLVEKVDSVIHQKLSCALGGCCHL